MTDQIYHSPFLDDAFKNRLFLGRSVSFIRYMNPDLDRNDQSSLSEAPKPARHTIMARFLDAIEMLVHIFFPSWYLRSIGVGIRFGNDE